MGELINLVMAYIRTKNVALLPDSWFDSALAEIPELAGQSVQFGLLPVARQVHDASVEIDRAQMATLVCALLVSSSPKMPALPLSFGATVKALSRDDILSAIAGLTS